MNYRNIRKVNFEISNAQYKKIKAYADFFCMNRNSFMQMLVCVGIQEYHEKNLTTIKKNIIAKEEKTRLKELNKKVEILRSEIKYVSDKVRESKEVMLEYLIKEEIPEHVSKKNSLSTRCKINVSEDVYNEIVLIFKEQKQDEKNLCKSDVICELIRFTLEKHLKYLEKLAPYELKIRDRRSDEERYGEISTVFYEIKRKIPNTEKDKWKRRKIEKINVTDKIPEYIPLNEESYWSNNEKVSMSFEVPKIFYDFLIEQANKYNVKPEDYVKLLIEGDFAEGKKTQNNI